MSNWAIVIGINEYWTAGANLTLAVKDALDITQWLADKNGGNVPPQNLYLLTSPKAPETFSDGAALPKEIEKRDATFLSLKKTITDLMRQSNGKGERFYFYFSGHGVTNKEFENTEALLMTDFEKDNPDNSMTIDSMRKYFQTVNFKEQIFIFDACRNFSAWQGRFTLGRFPHTGEPTAEFTPAQFLLFATAPLLRAAERVRPDETNSAFTKILLEGLKGKGTAKFYHVDEEKYHVNVENLFKYVKRKVEDRKISVSKADSSIYQSPLSDIYSYQGEFPVLVKYDKNAFDEEKLQIHVSPPDVLKEAQIFVSSADSNYYQIISPVANSPIELPQKTQKRQKLLPMTYNIQAFAKGFKHQIKPSRHFDLYEPKSIFIEFSADDGGQPGGRPPWIKTRGGRLPSRADLIVKSADPLAPLEIRNGNYELVAFGQGHLTAREQKPGLYRARLVLPEGDISEEIIELRGKDEEITLAAPVPSASLSFDELINHTTVLTLADIIDLRTHTEPNRANGASGVRVIIIQEELQTENEAAGFGQEINISPSTDALENSERKQPPAEYAQAIIEAAEKSLSNLTSSINTASELKNAADEIRRLVVEQMPYPAQANEYLSQVEINLREQNRDSREISLNAAISPISAGGAQYETETAPGNYFLSIKLPDRNAASFSVSVLPARTTLLILHRHRDGKLNVFSFSPAAGIEANDALQREAANQLRRMELLQRFRIHNRAGDIHALQYADDLSRTERLDPFAGCLAGYTKLSLNKSDELGDLVGALVELYDALSDSHVLRAEFLASRGAPDGEIKNEYLKALNCGIPIFAEGVKRLVQAVEKYNLEHARVSQLYEIFDNHTRNILWTSWTTS